ncbi:EAL domain-containing protein [Sphingobium indicum]|uniref:Histidine kinase n=2 Tax=Sphingobium indicum TaxID=332055 RepID=A0A1L5BQ34_SPHIB|nr:EAL domain-containing protein [Sphingobium indicum]APL95015.1 histidine kinase [Sphingobium indicum B90A]KEY97591.1 histidine kinase [Sphingomonas sp. BHC-A]NYI23806.1 diguanylate cyclase (GGDEF)-like protein/PAS domain S-box-containing protein [Sphingobium indicum]RYM00339.1 EAL domain-containing protein [Sphingobium indicum]
MDGDQQILASAGVLRCAVDGDGRLHPDPAAAHRFGLRESQQFFRWLRGVCGIFRKPIFQFVRAVRKEREAETTLTLKGDFGELRNVRILARARSAPLDRTVFELVAIDVTSEHAEIELLRRSMENLRLIVEYNPQLPWIADAEGRIIDFTDRWLESSGLERDEAEGSGWLSATHPDDIEPVTRRVAQSHATGEPFDVRVRLMVNDQYRWMRAQAYPRRDEEGRIIRWYGYTEDIHESVLIEEQMRWNAEHDSLTELPNRAMFNACLDKALAKALTEFRKVGVFLLDIDNFKDVNDLMGHHAGDDLLKSFASRLKDIFAGDGVVARLGGDEFAILIENVESRQQLADLANRVLTIRETLFAAGRSLECGVSIGVAAFPEDGRVATELLRHADLALYRAKSLGRGRMQMFEQSLLEDMQERVAMINRARTAVRDGTIISYYQPKVSLQTGELVGFEALLRWRDSCGTIRSPAEIYAAFDDHDVADMIGQTMTSQVFADMAAWRARGLPVGHVAINVSSAELRRERFAGRLIETMDRYSIAPDSIEIEITEGVFLGAASDTVRRSIDELHMCNIPLALDDFGTGFASLSHLRSLPVSTLKIDRSFVSGVTARESDGAIVSALVTLGRALNMKVVAEGVEEADQSIRLREMGCDYAQGFYFGRPAPSENIPALIQSWGENSAIVTLNRRAAAWPPPGIRGESRTGSRSA